MSEANKPAWTYINADDPYDNDKLNTLDPNALVDLIDKPEAGAKLCIVQRQEVWAVDAATGEASEMVFAVVKKRDLTEEEAASIHNSITEDKILLSALDAVFRA